MKTTILRYSKSLTIEKTMIIDFKHIDQLVNPGFDFGHQIQVQTYRQMR